MTDEQIKQNAEEYYDKLDSITIEVENEPNSIVDAYIAGAHIRDEEIGRMNTTIRLYANQIAQLRKEIEQLRNPWISVKNHLPEMFVDSKGITYDFSVKVLVTNENNPNYWHVAEYYPDKNEWCCLEHPTYIINNVTHWMPITKLKKEE